MGVDGFFENAYTQARPFTVNYAPCFPLLCTWSTNVATVDDTRPLSVFQWPDGRFASTTVSELGRYVTIPCLVRRSRIIVNYVRE